jgi:hypothetical protein
MGVKIVPNEKDTKKITKYKIKEFKKPKKAKGAFKDILPPIDGKLKSKKVKEGSKKDERLSKKGYKSGSPFDQQEVKNDGASKKFPEIKKKNEGKFTAWVEKNMGGMDTCKAASKVMRSRTKKYSPAVVKMANYANNFGCKNKKDGASFNPKLKKAVADGKIKGKFAEKIMSSDGASLRSKRADKLVSQGRIHKKMSPEQKKEAIKNKSARFVQEGASMKKQPLKKIAKKK